MVHESAVEAFYENSEGERNTQATWHPKNELVEMSVRLGDGK